MSIAVYTIPELMPLLRLKKRAIRKLISTGKLSGRLVGKQWLVTEQALNAFLNSPDGTLSKPCAANGRS